jgi:hypothetical protein
MWRTPESWAKDFPAVLHFDIFISNLTGGVLLSGSKYADQGRHVCGR